LQDCTCARLPQRRQGQSCRPRPHRRSLLRA